MLIVSQKGKIRVNYDNVAYIFTKEENGFLLICANLINGNDVELYRSLSEENREKALVSLDEAIIDLERYKHLKTSNISYIKDIDEELCIFYMGECLA